MSSALKSLKKNKSFHTIMLEMGYGKTVFK